MSEETKKNDMSDDITIKPIDLNVGDVIMKGVETRGGREPTAEEWKRYKEDKCPLCGSDDIDFCWMSENGGGDCCCTCSAEWDVFGYMTDKERIMIRSKEESAKFYDAVQKVLKKDE